MRKRKMIRVKNAPGMLIQKPSIGVIRPMIFMVYNGQKTDEGVVAVDMEWEVPADQYHLRKLAKGELLLADKPKPVRPKKEDNK
jgi:hypothetical protein